MIYDVIFVYNKIVIYHLPITNTLAIALTQNIMISISKFGTHVKYGDKQKRDDLDIDREIEYINLAIFRQTELACTIFGIINGLNSNRINRRII